MVRVGDRDVWMITHWMVLRMAIFKPRNVVIHRDEASQNYTTKCKHLSSGFIHDVRYQKHDEINNAWSSVSSLSSPSSPVSEPYPITLSSVDPLAVTQVSYPPSPSPVQPPFYYPYICNHDTQDAHQSHPVIPSNSLAHCSFPNVWLRNSFGLWIVHLAAYDRCVGDRPIGM